MQALTLREIDGVSGGHFLCAPLPSLSFNPLTLFSGFTYSSYTVSIKSTLTSRVSCKPQLTLCQPPRQQCNPPQPTPPVSTPDPVFPPDPL